MWEQTPPFKGHFLCLGEGHRVKFYPQYSQFSKQARKNYTAHLQAALMWMALTLLMASFASAHSASDRSHDIGSTNQTLSELDHTWKRHSSLVPGSPLPSTKKKKADKNKDNSSQKRKLLDLALGPMPPHRNIINLNQIGGPPYPVFHSWILWFQNNPQTNSNFSKLDLDYFDLTQKKKSFSYGQTQCSDCQLRPSHWISTEGLCLPAG